MCFPYIIKHNFVAKIWIRSVFLSFCKSFGKVIWTCNAVPGTTFTVRFPENNCTP